MKTFNVTMTDGNKPTISADYYCQDVSGNTHFRNSNIPPMKDETVVSYPTKTVKSIEKLKE